MGAGRGGSLGVVGDVGARKMGAHGGRGPHEVRRGEARLSREQGVVGWCW